MAGCAVKTVLLGADASDEFKLVVAFAAGLPAIGVERILAGHVIETEGVDGAAADGSADAMREHVMQAVLPLSDAGMDVEVRVAAGDPTEVLLDMARDAHVDAVVAGTHAKSIDDRLMEGSVSDSLAMTASIPVLLVRISTLAGAEDPAGIAARMGGVVLVPTDFSSAAGRALDRACALATETHGLVRIVAVVPQDGRPTPALDDLGTRCKGRGVHTSFVRRSGDPAAEILAEARASGATSIVMGTRGRTAVGEALLGSVSMSVVREADCPVMIVP